MIKRTTIVLFLTSSCATVNYKRVDLRNMLNSWKGKPVDTLIETWGGPTNVHRVDNGKKAITYQGLFIRSSSSSHHSLLFYDHSHSSKVTSATCRITWFTDTEGKQLVDAKVSGSPLGCQDFLSAAPN